MNVCLINHRLLKGLENLRWSEIFNSLYILNQEIASYSEIIPLPIVLAGYDIKQYQYVWIAKSNSKKSKEIKAVPRNN